MGVLRFIRTKEKLLSSNLAPRTLSSSLNIFLVASILARAIEMSGELLIRLINNSGDQEHKSDSTSIGLNSVSVSYS